MVNFRMEQGCWNACSGVAAAVPVAADGALVGAGEEQDGESEGGTGRRKCGEGERVIGEASGECGAGRLSDADRADQPRVRLAGPAVGVRASVVTYAQATTTVRNAPGRATAAVAAYGL